MGIRIRCRNIFKTRLATSRKFGTFRKLFNSLLSNLKHFPRAVALHLGEVELPGPGGEHAVLARLQDNQLVGEFVGAWRQAIGGPGDVVVVHLGAAEIPPTPAFSVRTARVVYRRGALLTGLQAGV